MFEYYNHLGFQNPYYKKDSTGLILNHDFSKLISNSANNIVDFTSIVELLNTGYIFGDRTLVEGINKTPWMARPNTTSPNEWEYFDVKITDNNEIQSDEIPFIFFEKLKEELYTYIKNKKNIGLLLTGGMDSRIVSCVLNAVIKDYHISDISVYAYTWGEADSRDVIYAKQIANLFNWNWEHLLIDANQVEENISIAVENGCEFSPIHLHAMAQIRNKSHLDCVLAGSFGDSIGRGEYSGKRILNIKPVAHKIQNVAGLFRGDYIKLSKLKIQRDISNYHKLFPQNKEYQLLEQDYQLHYMRRMLNPCLGIINKVKPVYQMFSAPDVYSFIWSLNPELRTDKIYYELLKGNSPELLEIPWARNGLMFGQTHGIPDNYKNKSIDYGALIRNNLLNELEDKIKDSKLMTLNLFDEASIYRLIKLIRTKPIANSYFFEDKIIWIAAFADFVDKYDIQSSLSKHPHTLLNSIGLIKEYYKRYYFYNHRKKINRIRKFYI